MLQPPPPTDNYVLQDVHGAGAQRSDPKTGDPADYPYGHGPQGDVIRIFNYVRAVRDAEPAVGGITGVPDADAAPSEVPGPSGDDHGLLIALASSVAGLLALAGGAWYLRRRLVR